MQYLLFSVSKVIQWTGSLLRINIDAVNAWVIDAEPPEVGICVGGKVQKKLVAAEVDNFVTKVTSRDPEIIYIPSNELIECGDYKWLVLYPVLIDKQLFIWKRNSRNQCGFFCIKYTEKALAIESPVYQILHSFWMLVNCVYNLMSIRTYIWPTLSGPYTRMSRLSYSSSDWKSRKVNFKNSNVPCRKNKTSTKLFEKWKGSWKGKSEAIQ